jgi:hypothetical protein
MPSIGLAGPSSDHAKASKPLVNCKANQAGEALVGLVGQKAIKTRIKLGWHVRPLNFYG